MVHTKGYYKEKWVEQQAVSLSGRAHVISPTPSNRKPYPLLPACYVRLERLNRAEGPPAKLGQNAPYCPNTAPITDVTEISSDSYPDLTPPRKVRPGSHPPTPSPTVSPAGGRDNQGAASWANPTSPLPLTQGRRRQSVASMSPTSSSYSTSSSTTSSTSSSSSTTSESSVATVKGRAQRPGEGSQPERINQRLASTRESYIPPRPPKPTDKRPQPPKEQQIGGRPFQTYEVLSEEVRQGPPRKQPLRQTRDGRWRQVLDLQTTTRLARHNNSRKSSRRYGIGWDAPQKISEDTTIYVDGRGNRR